MLTEEDLKFSFQLLYSAAELSLFPFRMNRKTWKFEREGRAWKRRLFLFLYFLQCSHLGFNLFRLGQAILSFEAAKLGHFGCSCLCTSGEFVAILDLYLQFYKNPEFTFCIYNRVVDYFVEEKTTQIQELNESLESVAENGESEKTGENNIPSEQGGGDQVVPGISPEKKKKPDPLTRMGQLNLQEFLAVNLCPGMLSCILLHLFLFLRNPTAFNFVFSTLPPDLQNPLMTGIFAVFEMYITLFWVTGINLRLFLNVLFIIMCRERVEEEIHIMRQEVAKNSANQGEGGIRTMSWKSTSAAIQVGLTKCRELQLLLGIYNLAYATINFVLKLENLLNATFLFFIAIHLLRTNLPESLMFFWIALNAGSIFPVSYDSAFKIPEGILDLKREMLLANKILVRDLKKQAGIQRTIKSIPAMGIKIGSFRVVERTATADFVDFTFSKICDLLLTFK